MMNFDSIDTNSISIVEGEFGQLAAMLTGESQIQCESLEIETESGERFLVEYNPGYSGLTISLTDDTA